ncbi:MAG: dihydroorotate dehydrogenase [Planctomycetota bacterium]|nr:dihydroorotate dehydrogenase [Planctomycetota bacterium]MDA1201482.1 dihydroorotate dehydrogenase [Planctomycetota bacterium]
MPPPSSPASAGPPPSLAMSLGRLRLPNPILVASGTFGYGQEMAGFVDLARLGGIIPKTITPRPRKGNVPWRTVETASGLLNSIGLDNDGVETFLEKQLPFLAGCGAPVIVSIAGGDADEFVGLARRLEGVPGIAAIELNISCPNVSHGVDLGTDPEICRGVVAGVREVTSLPVIAKLTPNVTDIVAVARGAAEGGADAVTLINTLQGMAVDWRRRRPLLGNVVGGLSGPAIKPVALRCVHQVHRAVGIPIIGVGGIMTIDDCLEFFVAGASAVQIGTASFAEPVVSGRLLDELPVVVAEAGVTSLADLVGSLQVPAAAGSQPPASQEVSQEMVHGD